MSVLIFLTPLATTLKGLERAGSPLTEDFSTLKGVGFKLTEAITEDAISNSFLVIGMGNKTRSFYVIIL